MNNMPGNLVLMVSDLSKGGAAIACRRLHAGLMNMAVDAQWVAMRGESGAAVISAMDWPDLFSIVCQRLGSRLFRSPYRLSYLKQFHAERSAVKLVRRYHPRLINLHNIHEAASFRFVEHLPKDVPIVWTMHDMWPVTGYCCYSYGCEKYRNGCKGDCPERGKWGEVRETAAFDWQRRRRFYQTVRDRMVLVSPSRWLADIARSSCPLSVEHIPNSVDTEVFHPVASRQVVREALGLPLDKSILLTGLAAPDDPRKGTHYLCEALAQVDDLRQSCVVVAMGGVGARSKVPADWIAPGYIHDERLLNLYYNAADAFVLPSLADNLPNTFLESLAAGTPCVAFDVGGCGEVVREGVTGFLARPRDVVDLAACLTRVMRLGVAAEQCLRATCREVAVRDYAPEKQARAYMALFESLAKKKL